MSRTCNAYSSTRKSETINHYLHKFSRGIVRYSVPSTGSLPDISIYPWTFDRGGKVFGLEFVEPFHNINLVRLQRGNTSQNVMVKKNPPCRSIRATLQTDRANEQVFVPTIALSSFVFNFYYCDSLFAPRGNQTPFFLPPSFGSCFLLLLR